MATNKNKKKLRAPKVADSELSRVVTNIYDELNKLASGPSEAATQNIRVTSVTQSQLPANPEFDNVLVDTLRFNTAYSPTGNESQGTFYWNPDDETVSLVTNGSTLELGHALEIHVKVTDPDGVSKGDVVGATGAVGASGKIEVQKFTAGTSPTKTIVGIMAENVATGEFGKAVAFGKIRKIDTDGPDWNEGTILYAGIGGALTDIEPSEGYVKLPIAFVVNRHQNNGEIFVRITPIDENIDADKLDGQHGSYYLDYANFTNTPTDRYVNLLNFDSSDFTVDIQYNDSSPSIDGLSWAHTHSQYLTAEVNDLTSAVTWANVPDANITESSVTQHQSALSIDKSQITNFGVYDNYQYWTLTVGLDSSNVTSTDSVTFIAGDNVTLGKSGSNITINSSAPSGYINSITTDTNSGLTSEQSGSSVDIALSLNNLEVMTATPDSQESIAILDGPNTKKITLGNISLAAFDNTTSGFITDYTVTESDVTQHQAALTISESQISPALNYDNYDYWTLTVNATNRNISSNDVLTLIGGDNVTLEVDANNITINSSLPTGAIDTITTDTNSGLSSSESSGEVTITLDIDNLEAVTTAESVDSIAVLDGPTTKKITLGDLPLSAMDNTASGFISDYTVTESDVTQHQSALAIAESQITFTSSFIELGDLSISTQPAEAGGSLTYNTGTGVFTFKPASIPNVDNFIELTDLSVGTPNQPSGSGSISYSNTNGVFTYTPPDLSPYLTSYTETNDLTSAVTWANVPDANITSSSVTQHIVIGLPAPASGGGSLAFTNGEFIFTPAAVPDVSNFITLSEARQGISVGVSAQPSGNGNLSYTSNNGTFTYTPPDLSSYLTEVTSSDVTQHEGDLTIDKSQITNFGTYDNYVSWAITDGTNSGNVTSGKQISFIGSGDTTVSYNDSTGFVTISSTDTNTDTNYYLNGAQWATGTGDLTLNVQGTNDVTINLDGRYLTSLPTHNHDNLYYTETEVNNLLAAKDNYVSWTVSDGTNTEAITTGATLQFAGAGAASVAYNPSNNILTITSIDTNTDTNYYAINTGTGYNATSKELTIAMQGTTNVTVDLSAIDADKLDGQEGTYYLDYNNFDNTPALNFDNYGSWTISDSASPTPNSESITSGATLKFAGGGATTVAYNPSNNIMTISSTDTNTDTNWYPTNGDTYVTNGVITLGGVGMTDVTIDLTGSFLSAHPAVANVPGDSNNTGNVVIQDLFFDSFGHVNGIATKNFTGVFDNYGSWNISADGVTEAINSGNTLYVVGTNDASVSYNASLNQLTIDVQTPAGSNYYLNSVTGNGNSTVQFDFAGDPNDIASFSHDFSHNHNSLYYTETEIGNFFSGSSAISGYNKSNWDTAYSWGDHDGVYLPLSGGTLTGNLTVGNGTADMTVRTYHSDASYTELKGYGVQFNRATSYIRPTVTATKELLVGSSTLKWQAIKFDADAVQFNDGGTLLMNLDGNGDLNITNDLDVGIDLRVGGNITATGTLSASGYNKSNWDSAYNKYVSAISFATGTGVLTLTKNDTSTITVDLDGRYLTSVPSEYLTQTEGDARYLRLSGGTITGNLVVEDSEVHVGDVSNDSWTRIKHAQANGYGFNWQHSNATVIVNEQGTTNEVLVLGDVDAGDYSGLLGVAHSPNGGSSWTKKLDLRGNGEMYIGSSGTSRVFHDGYHPNADKLTTAREITLGGDLTGSAFFDGSSDITISAQVSNNSHTHDDRYLQLTGGTLTGDVTIGSFGNNNAEFSVGQTIANKVFSYGVEFQTQNSDIQLVLGRNNGTTVQGTGGIGASSTNAFHVYDTTSVTKLFEVAQTSGNTTIAGDLDVDGTTTTNKLVADNTATIGFSNLANASILAGTTSLGIGIDPNEIRANGTHLYIGTIGANNIDFGTGGTNGQVVIQSGGNVGIGTTSPGSKLTINGGINNVWSYSTTTTDQPGFVAANNVDTSSQTNLLYAKIYGSGIAANAFGVTLGNYGVVATDGSANNGLLLGTFNTKPLIIGTNAAERMRIDSSGNVGIGTTSPSEILNVKSKGSTADQITLTHSGNEVNIVAIGQESSHGSLILRSNSGVNKVRLSAAGNNSYILDSNVGIGTTTPANKLDVNGGIDADTLNTGQGDNELYAMDQNVRTSDNVTFNNISGYDITSSNYLNVGASTGIKSTGWVHLQRYQSNTNVAIGNNGSNVDLLIPNGDIDLGGNLIVDGTSTFSGNLTVSDGTRGIRIFNDASGNGDRAGIIFDIDSSDGIGVGSDYLMIVQDGINESYIQTANAGSGNLNIRKGTTDLMTIKGTGNVGIGTGSPSTKLHVGTGSGASAYQSGNDGIIVERNGRASINLLTPNTSDAYIFFADPQAGNSGYVGYEHANDRMVFRSLGDFSFSGNNVGIGTTSPSKKLHVKSGDNEGIFMEGTGGGHWFNFKSGTSNLWSMGAQSGLMGWYNRTDSSYKMVITDDGNVGIGTTSPTYKLEVHGSSTGSHRLRVVNATTGQSSVDLKTSQQETRLIAVNSKPFYVYDQSASAELFTIKTGGNVGIGTTNPSAKLHTVQTSAAEGLRIDGASSGFALIVQGGTSYKTSMRNASVGNNYGGNTPPTNGLIVEGNVGIGTTSPATELDVEGTITSNNLKLQNLVSNTSDTAVLTLDQGQNVRVRTLGSNAFNSTSYLPLSGGTMTGNLEISNGSPTIAFETGATHYNWQIGAQENVDAGFEISVGNQDANAGDDTFSPKLVVKQSGNVGIGTTSPSYELDVRGTTADSRIYLDDGATGAEIYLRSMGSGECGLYLSSNSRITRQGGDLNIVANAIDMNFSTNNGTTNHLRIDTSGDVTISNDLNIGGTTLADDTIVVRKNVAGTFQGLVIDNSRSTLDEVGNISKLGFQHNSVNAGEIRSVTEEDFTATANQSARLEFYTIQNGTLSQALQLQVDNDAVFYGDLYVPDQIIHSGDDNTYMQFHGDDLWRVVTGGSERIEVSNTGIIINDGSNDYDFRVESNDNANMIFLDAGSNSVGIGTGSPETSAALTVYDATSDAPLRVVSGDSHTGIGFKDSVTQNYLFYTGAENHFYFNGSGVTLGVGVSSITTTNLSLDVENKVRASGIMFGTDTSDANTLDDYEEGTFTPTIHAGASNIVLATNNYGKYTRIGNVVHCSGRFQSTSLTPGSSSINVELGGLPFTASTPLGSGTGAIAGAIGFASGFFGEAPTSMQIRDNESNAYLYYQNAIFSFSNLKGDDFSSGANTIVFQITYHVA